MNNARPKITTNDSVAWDTSKVIDVEISDIRFSWTAVPRASYYALELSEPSDTGYGFSFTGKNLCIANSTETSVVMGTVDPSNSGSSTHASEYYQDAGDCLSRVTEGSAQRITEGKYYAWRVTAVDLDAKLGTKPALNPDTMGLMRTTWSETAAFRAVSATDTVSTIKDSEPAISHDGTSPAPLFSWRPVEGAAFYAVSVRLGNDAAQRNVIKFYTSSTSFRPNGIFDDLDITQATDKYRWTLQTCYFNAGGPLCATETTFNYLDTPASVQFSRTSPKLDQPLVNGAATSSVQTITSDKLVASWTHANALKGADGLPRFTGTVNGYLVEIRNNAGAVILTDTVDTPFWQYSARETSGKFTKLAFDTDYSLSVSAIDAYGQPSTKSAATKFKLTAPQPQKMWAQENGSSVLLGWNWNAKSSPGTVESRLISNGKVLTSLPTGSLGKTNLTAQVAALPVEDSYSWQIRVTDPLGIEGTWKTAQNVTRGDLVTIENSTSGALSPAERTLNWTTVNPELVSHYGVTVTLNSGTVGTEVQTASSRFSPVGLKERFSTSSDLSYAKGSYSYEVTAYNESGVRIGSSYATNFSVLSLPTKPSLGTVKADGTTITAVWTPLTLGARGTNGTVNYEVRYRPVTFPESDWINLPKTANNAGQVVVSSLKKATTYEFSVRAINEIGASDWSASRSATTLDAPGTPTVSAPTSTLDSIKLSWSNAGALASSYEVRFRPSTSNTWTTSSVTSRSFTATSLMANTTYYWEVRAKNGAGFGPSATGSIKTKSLPGVPSSVAAKSGDKFATVSWKAPSAGSSAITRYSVQKRTYNAKTKKWSAWSSAGSSTTTSFRASSLLNGTTYQFRVSATTQIGTGTFSSAASVVPAGKPFAATVKATSTKKKQIKITWSGAKANGSKITKHKVQISTNGKKWTTVKTASASTKSFTYKKAKSGKKYYVRVVTYNKIGAATSTARNLKAK